MKILLATKTMDMGGIERSIVALAQELQARGHQTWVVSGGGYLVRELERGGVPHVAARLELISPIGLAQSARFLRRLIHDEGIELVHSFSATTSVALRMALSNRASNGFSRVRMISSPMGLQNSPRELPVTTWLRNWFLTFGAERILVISPEIRRHLRGVRAREDALVDFNFVGLYPDRFQSSEADYLSVRQEFGFPPDAQIVSTIGALHPRKSHDLFIDAAAIIATHAPRARFLVVGEGELRDELQRRAYARGLQEKLVLAGVREDIPRILGATDVYVKPGVVEGFIGITVLEALALGNAVVAFDTEDVKLALTDGVTGLIVPNGDVEALAERVQHLLENPATGADMGAAGRKLVVEQFHFGLLAERLEQFYQQLIATAPPWLAPASAS